MTSMFNNHDKKKQIYINAQYISFLENTVMISSYFKINLTISIYFRQEAFMENYFASQRDNIFRNVEVLIYVFDVESRELEKDMHYYQSCLEAILQNSPDAKVFCLVHKMDLVQDDQRDMVWQRIKPLKFLKLKVFKI